MTAVIALVAALSGMLILVLILGPIGYAILDRVFGELEDPEECWDIPDEPEGEP